MSTANKAMSFIRRHFGVISSFVVSISNFLLLIVLQQGSSPEDFGSFALLQVFLQAGIGLSNALFCSPLVVILSGGQNNQVIGSFAKFSAIFCCFVAGAACFFISLLKVDLTVIMASYFLLLFSWQRWFYRSVEIATENYSTPAVADLCYSFTVLSGVAVIWYLGELTLLTVVLLQLVGALAALLTLGSGAKKSMTGMWRAQWKPFWDGFSRHGRWALLGVATTEATTNSHSYMIGFALGPAAFAPIAAANLLFRPINILAQALTQYERPKMARHFKIGDNSLFERCLTQFLQLSIGLWLLNGVLAFSVLYIPVKYTGLDNYDRWTFITATAILFAIYLARSLRGAESAALQAIGQFRILAFTAIGSAPITLLGSAALIFIFRVDAVHTLWAVFAGELVMWALTKLAYHRFMNTGPRQGAFQVVN